MKHLIPKVREIQNLSTSIATEELELESRNRKILALKDEITRASQALEEFRKGKTWQSLQDMQEEFNAASNRVKKTEANLSALVLPLSGHLSRIQKLHESGRYTLKPEVKQQLDICLEVSHTCRSFLFPGTSKGV